MATTPSTSAIVLLLSLAHAAAFSTAVTHKHRHHHRSRSFARRHFHASAATLAAPDADALATGLGYLVGAGSLLLYTPIAFRVVRQGSADGLTLSTWWLKIASYTASDLYALRNGYPIAQWAETLVITAEAAAVLILVATYQRRLDASFFALALACAATASWLLTAAPPAARARASVVPRVHTARPSRPPRALTGTTSSRIGSSRTDMFDWKMALAPAIEETANALAVSRAAELAAARAASIGGNGQPSNGPLEEGGFLYPDSYSPPPGGRDEFGLDHPSIPYLQFSGTPPQSLQ